MNDARTRKTIAPTPLSLLPIIALMIAIALSGCGGGEPTPSTAITPSPAGDAAEDGDMAEDGDTAEDGGMSITSSAFEENTTVPEVYTCEGENSSPPLAFNAVPAEAESLVLIVDDPDAPSGTWVHWVLFDIPAETEGFEAGEKDGVSGVGSQDKTGYAGPCPPPGDGPHRYFFKLYALDVATLGLDEKASKSDVETAMEDHIIATAELVGLYERQ
jgi:Raf kinase inhibitor-like YbhB/YbcL family protein